MLLTTAVVHPLPVAFLSPVQPRRRSRDEDRPQCQAARDQRLIRYLASYSEHDADYWSYRGKATREHAHAYFQYPAMMVPQMQGDLIRTARQVAPDVGSVYDPYLGSGTVLSEAMTQGLDFSGQDINPLAVLLCRAKSGPFAEADLRARAETLFHRIRQDTSTAIEVRFPGLDKWFRADVQVALSRIRRAIVVESDLATRRFFWVALAETVRLTSNSRTSTFKLHIRPKEELDRELDPVGLFSVILTRNLDNLAKQRALLAERRWLDGDAYRGRVDVRLGDSSQADEPGKTTPEYDLFVSSPSYGDNATTVPYGQHSFLPLQWIGGADIDDAYDPSCLETTHSIDSRSLGGKRSNALKHVEPLLESSPSLRSTLDALREMPADRRSRVVAFCRDLDHCLDPILRRLKPNAYMFWTVGNRRVGGLVMPLDDILSEFLTARRAEEIVRLKRGIHSKRMAHKNNIAATMSTETVVVMRKGSFP